MEIRTVENIIRLLKKDNISLTRDKFAYYSKIGLLFSPERKVKKRLKEGIKTFYAEEITDRFKRIEHFKEKGYSLNEIKRILLEEDKNHITALYKNAGISLGLPGLGESSLAEAKAEQWMKGGYYQGLFTIYGDVIEKIKIGITEEQAKINMLDSISGKLLKESSCSEDETRIKRIFKHEKAILQKSIQNKEVLLADFREKYLKLEDFLHTQVYSPVVWDKEKEEMIFE